MRYAILALLTLLALTGPLSPSLALGQEGTAPLVLRVPASPRAASVGNAYAGVRGSDVVFGTPAAIALVTGVFASVGRYGSASTLGSAASATAIGRVGIAFGVLWLDYDARPGVFPNPVGELTVAGPVASSSLAALVAGSYRVWGFRVGAAAKYVEERVGSTRGSGPGFDVGVQRDVGRFTLGLVAQNLGPALDVGPASAKLPTRVVVGATSPRVPLGTWFDLGASAAVGWERELGIVPGGGVSLFYLPLEGWTVALRAGARRVETDGPNRPFPVTVGAGMTVDRVSVDYAWEPWRGTGAAHRLGFRIE